MAIKFLNIRSREVAVAETEPQISAMWGSSDRSPNVTQGQDMGWRLAPEVVVEMKQIKQDLRLVESIAARYSVLPQDVGETEILLYISDKTRTENAPIADESDYSDEYDAEIRRLERKAQEASAKMPEATEEPQESLADLEKRVELEERLAAARAQVGEPVTTTTTTVAPKPPTAKK